MGRRRHYANAPGRRVAARCKKLRLAHAQRLAPPLARVDRKSLLLGTALASTLLLGGSLLAFTSAAAVDCTQNPPFPPDPIIDFNVPDAITCFNTADRNNDGVSNVILLTTTGVNSFVDLFNSGDLTALIGAAANGIYMATADARSEIGIVNVGDITATSTGNDALGIFAKTEEANSAIAIAKSGDIVVTAAGAAQAFSLVAMAPTVAWQLPIRATSKR